MPDFSKGRELLQGLAALARAAKRSDLAERAERAAARWEREELLLSAASENELRRVTEELCRMAGCSSVSGAG